MTMTTTAGTDFDPYLTAIIANHIDGIVREMTHTLLRAARSAVISSARDFSCSIVTGDNQLLASAEGLPIHIFGSHMQSKAMTDFHGDDIREGDAYLHNDPYTGGTHAADHTILVPVFFEGEHLFTTVAKAHQADTGNAVPSTYSAGARDQYEEGALIFPAVRLQRDHVMNDDIVRMCRSRIRVPGQFYGDLLAGIGSARVGERRLKELCEKYGTEQIKAFIRGWLDYSEERMIQTIRRLPAATLTSNGAHDPVDGLPDGIPVTATIRIDPDEAIIELDLTDNVDNVDCGLNQSESTATASSIAGVFNSIDASVPCNSGSFRRIRVLLRDGAVVGRPTFPHSCSVATTNVSDRVVNTVQSAFAGIGEGWGLAEGGVGMGAGMAVCSGEDPSSSEGSYVNQLIIGTAGGPGAPGADGWPTYALPVVAGLMYRDSVEIDELKHPMRFGYLRMVPGSAGAGRYRSAPAMELSYGPLAAPMEVLWPCDGTINAPKGVRGGHDGSPARHVKVGTDGVITELPGIVAVTLTKGEVVQGVSSTGGGYGDPLDREPRRTRDDVLEGYETIERAREVYGVVLTGDVDERSLEVDVDATEVLRATLRAESGRRATTVSPHPIPRTGELDSHRKTFL
ncbi:hydantoinase B/oxoprolinase family protein [Gordonia sp. NPDC003376]